MGDSITGRGASPNPYCDIAAADMGCTTNNYGVGGSGWFTYSASLAGQPQHTDAFHQRVNQMAANADLITILGGTNDWANAGKPLVLGTYGDTDPNASFYGAVDSTIKQVVARYPTKTIAVLVPLPRGDGDTPNATTGIRMSHVANAVKEVCAKYSIPTLDWFTQSGFYWWDNGFRTAYYADGVHPNAAGHRLLADKIKAFLNAL